MTNPRMTKVHFDYIAEIIKGLTLGSNEEKAYVACVFADALAHTNRNFSKFQFLNAAMSTKDVVEKLDIKEE